MASPNPALKNNCPNIAQNVNTTTVFKVSIADNSICFIYFLFGLYRWDSLSGITYISISGANSISLSTTPILLANIFLLLSLLPIIIFDIPLTLENSAT